nr:hypothetical protein [Tanacetum cinerariifolium]
EQSLDDLFKSLKIYEAEVKSSSSSTIGSSNTDSTNEPVSAAASVSAVSAKIHVSSLLNVDSLTIVVDDLEEMDLKWQMAMLTDDSETKPSQNVPSFVQPNEQVKSPRSSVQHIKTYILAATPKPASPKPKSQGNSQNRKACFVCKSLDHLIKDCDYHEKKLANTTARNHATRGHHKHYASIPLLYPQRHVVPTAVVTQSKLVPINVAGPITADVPKISKGFFRVETPVFEGMLVAQEVEEGDADENVEKVNVGDTVEGDVSAAHGDVSTVDEEPSIPSPTP